MDVGDPSNFSRLLCLYEGSREKMASDIVGFSFSDFDTREAMVKVLKDHEYIMDPHGVVAYLGLQKFRKQSGIPRAGVFLETAHPGKFYEVVEGTLGRTIDMPESLTQLFTKKKVSIRVAATIEDVRDQLLRSAT
jgi:threonine synthase